MMILFVALLTSACTCVATDSSVGSEAEDRGRFWPFDVVGASIGRHLRDTFSLADEAAQSAASVRAEDPVAEKAKNPTGPRVISPNMKDFDPVQASLVSMPREYWVNDLDEAGVINVKLNSQLQVMPGKVMPERVPTTSLMEYLPFDIIGSLFRKLEARPEVKQSIAKNLRPIDDASVGKTVSVNNRNESGIIEVKLDSELQTQAGSSSPDTSQFSIFWPYEAITSFVHKFWKGREAEKPLDIPELVATKNSFINKGGSIDLTNETGILVVPLASELQVGESSDEASRRLRGSVQHPAATVVVAGYPRMLFVLIGFLFVGGVKALNNCIDGTHDSERPHDDTSGRLLPPQGTGPPLSLRSPRILPSPRTLKSPRINPEYGACRPPVARYKRPEIPKVNLDTVREARAQDEDVQAIRGIF